MKRKPHPVAATELRKHAEKRLRERTGQSGNGNDRPPADTQRLLHELQVHQIELEMQNDELRKARDEMEAGLEKYSELYDFAPVGYLTLDQEGAISETNLTAATLLGVPRASLVKQRLAFFVDPHDRPHFHSFILQVFGTKTRKECDVRLLVNGKRAVDVRLEANLVASGQACRMAVLDITEEKQATNRVRVSELRYRRLFEAAQDGILILDPQTRRITEANPYIVQVLGYTREQLIGKELWEIGLLKDETASQVAFRELKRKGFIRYEDLPLETRGGQRREVEFVSNLYDEGGETVIQCNIRDITDRRKADESLRAARLKLAQHSSLLEKTVTARTRELRATNQRLTLALESTRLSEEQNRVLLLESEGMQTKLRLLTHQILTAQEEERKRISRELHDDVVQTLVGINVEMSGLTKGDFPNVKHLQARIVRTQRLVASAVDSVHRFARELRPSVLDDLGLIPALLAYCKSLAERKKLKIHLTASRGVEKLDIDRRTVLFRVAQEALTNVALHARASGVEITISKLPGGVRMEITDNGKSFSVQTTLRSKTNQRLGLVGMRERLEMIGGKLTIESAPGQGTTVRAEIPFAFKETKA